MGAGILLIILGAGLSYAGYKIVDNRKKYEFHNRNRNSGLVQFKNWRATKTHAFTIWIGKAVGVIGILTLGAGVLVLALLLK